MPIMVGGNDSVIWKIRGNRVNYALGDPPKGGVYYHEAVNETEPDEMFKITIKLPSGAPMPTLSDFPSAEISRSNGRIFLTLWVPIEPSNGKRGPAAPDPDQIAIDWMRK